MGNQAEGGQDFKENDSAAIGPAEPPPLDASAAAGAEPATEVPSDQPGRYAAVLAEIERQRTPRRSWLKSILILGVTLFIFFQLGWLLHGPRDVLIIIGVLLVHEAGHLLGMRLFRYRNVRMFFIPLLGAAVSGENETVAGYKRAIVTLMGPVPGILIGIAFLLLALRTGTNLYLAISAMLLLINGFNLLPLMPLDGGRFLQEILFARNRYLEAAFRLLAAAALIAVTILLEAWLLGLLGVLVLLSIPNLLKVGSVAAACKGLVPAARPAGAYAVAGRPAEAGAIPPEIAEAIIEGVYRVVPAKLSPRTVATMARQVWERMNLRPPGVLLTLGLLVVYVAFLLLPLVGGAAVVLASPEASLVEYEKADGRMGLKEQVHMWGPLLSETEVDPDRFVYHGRTFHYYRDGKIEREGYWRDGRMDGEWKSYGQDGKLTSLHDWDKGEFVSSRKLVKGKWVGQGLEDLPGVLQRQHRKQSQGPPRGPKRTTRITRRAD